MSGFDFDRAPRSFSRRRIPEIDGAFWAHTGFIAGAVGLPAVPAHRLGLDWPRCFHSLGVALGQHEVRRLELTVAQQAFMDSPIARRIYPTVRQEAERATGAAAQPALDPGSIPGGSDQA